MQRCKIDSAKKPKKGGLHCIKLSMSKNLVNNQLPTESHQCLRIRSLYLLNMKKVIFTLISNARCKFQVKIFILSLSKRISAWGGSLKTRNPDKEGKFGTGHIQDSNLGSYFHLDS